MTAVVRTLCRDPRIRTAFLAVGVGLLVLTAGAFLYDTADAAPDPVPFDETTATGFGGEERFTLEERGYTIPRAQVFYSQFKFVVGFRGIEYAVDSFQQQGNAQQFGYPIAVYVSDFSGTSVTVSEEGYLETDRRTGWVQADSAQFVVGSEARLESGDTVVPFGSAAEAEAFVEEYGGEVIGWAELRDREFDIDDAAVLRDRVETHHERADERLAAVRPLADRKVDVVVGEDAPTIQAAVDAADAGSAIRVPPGTYNETVVVDRPVTIAGEDAHVRGDGNGSVIVVESDDVAITGLEISGVGNQTGAEDEEAVGEGWDERIESGYGHGDAGISVAEQRNFYVANVSIRTPADGVLLRDVNRSAIERLSVVGSDEWLDGFMGVMAMRSPTVVQESTFHAGRDGIYLHRSPTTVIRNNTFTENRFGVHFMYTSDAIITNNEARRQSSAGFTIMTDPSHNIVVGNVVRNASSGILPAGSHSYFAENVLVNNDRGMSTTASQSLYEHNLVYGNKLGLRASSLRPSNRVIKNDIVANDVAAEAGVGPLKIWTHDGTGNYWAQDTERFGPRSDAYSPTDPIDSSYGRVEGVSTLAASPAVTALDSVRATTPGMRQGDILDTAPLDEPVHPDRLAEIEREADE